MAAAVGEFRTNIVAGVSGLAAIILLSWSLSQLLNQPIPFDFTLQGMFLIAGALVVLSWFTRTSGEISIGFAMISAALLFVIFAFLPEWVVSVFATIVNPAISRVGLETSFQELIDNSVAILLITTVAVSFGIAASLRLTGRAKKPPIIVERTLTQLGKYADNYAEIIQLVVFFGIVLAGIIATQVGNLAAQAGEVIAQAPFVASNLTTAVIGFLTLGGSLPIVGQVPILGELSPVGFVTIAVVLILAAAAVRRDTSGSLSQFVRRL